MLLDDLLALTNSGLEGCVSSGFLFGDECFQVFVVGFDHEPDISPVGGAGRELIEAPLFCQGGSVGTISGS